MDRLSLPAVRASAREPQSYPKGVLSLDGEWNEEGEEGRRQSDARLHDHRPRDLRSGSAPRLEVRIDEPHAHSPEFFLLVSEASRVVPQMFGKADARIQLVPIERGAAFEIQLPAGSERIGQLRRCVQLDLFVARRRDRTRRPRRSRSWLARYEEIERQRARLARQAAPLHPSPSAPSSSTSSISTSRWRRSRAPSSVKRGSRGRRSASTVKATGSPSALLRHGNEGAFRLARVIEDAAAEHRAPHGVGARDGRRLEAQELSTSSSLRSTMAIDNAISNLVVDDYRKGLGSASRTRRAREGEGKRDRIFANVNHDLRSPLSLILLAVAEARRNGVEEGPRSARSAPSSMARAASFRMVDELVLAEGRETR